MNKSISSQITRFIIILLSFCFGVGAAYLFMQKKPNQATEVPEPKPLYWVAPMDANYQRDKPGKSPMGMDLIPVFETKQQTNTSNGAITSDAITISPDVIQNLGVRTGVATYAKLSSTITSVGYVKFNEDKLVHIHPRVSGWVEKLYVKSEGDRVIQDQPIYSLYSPELVNAQEELLLSLNRKNKRLIQASELRLKALQISDQFISALKATQVVQQTVNFYAPQTGVVHNLNIREGFYVQPGTTMLSIASLNEIWVETEIFERQSALVKQGDPLEVRLDYLPGKVWQGKVDYIYPTLDSKTRTLRIRTRLDNKDELLKPNMFAQVQVNISREAEKLLVPREAVIRTGLQNRVVLALGEGQFKSIAVQTGQSDLQNIEILSGLNEGDQVAVSAQFLLDSESSKTSDFKRFSTQNQKITDSKSTELLDDSVWVAAKIEKQLIDQGRVLVKHDAIEAWNMPAMTMEYGLSPAVDIKRLTPGTVLHMEVIQTKGQYQISAVHIMKQGKASTIDDKKSADIHQKNHNGE